MITEQDVTISVGAAGMPAALALPDPVASPVPGVVVIHEILGLTDDIRRITRRFSESGYAAVAPDLFAGLGPKPICMLRTLVAYHTGGGRALEAIEAARGWLAQRPEVDGERMGVAGFCMGGGFALLLGVQSDVAVAATFYGNIPGNIKELEGVCPVVAGYGGRDGFFADKGRQLDRSLRDLGISHDVKLYPEAGHGYMSHHSGPIAMFGRMTPLRTGYNEPAAEDSWSRMLTFFAEHLGANAGES